MKAVKLINRILKAALLLLLTVTISYGQNRFLNVKKKAIGKRVYLCKHVGKQKISARKFKIKEMAKAVQVQNTRKENVRDTFYIIPQPDADFLASNITIPVVAEEKAGDEVLENEMVAMPLPKPVYFRFDTDELTFDDLAQIHLAIEHIRLGKNIVLEGHTDSHGSNLYNMTLSHKRAVRIKNMIIEMGKVSPEAISIRYYGEDKPAVQNDSDENRQLNRRVEFIVLD